MVAQQPIRVMIVDDHEMVRDGLAVLIEGFEDLALVGEASNGVEAVELCSQVEPDVILMDLSMPKMDGIATTRVLRETYPHIQIIALSSSNDQEKQQLAKQAGVSEFLLKNASVSDIEEAIRFVFWLERDEIRHSFEGLIKLRQDVKYIINVGSVGQPRDNNPKACLSIFDSSKNTIEIKRVGYDTEGAKNKILKAGLPESLGYRLLEGR